jgi:hypothetical protein
MASQPHQRSSLTVTPPSSARERHQAHSSRDRLARCSSIQSTSFNGTISGFGRQDQIDLPDIGFSANTTLGYAANTGNTGGVPTATDGIHVANLAVLDQYSAASFAMVERRPRRHADHRSGRDRTEPADTAARMSKLES